MSAIKHFLKDLEDQSEDFYYEDSSNLYLLNEEELSELSESNQIFD
jgi:hypothetical protein|tara:strand:+ start:658 stop:795 length:138 start_codon:yes stop_codon:yes gene_type:complete